MRFLFFFLVFLLAFNLEARLCESMVLKKQKLSTIFHKIKDTNLCPEDYAHYALSAALAGRLGESIWLSSKALAYKNLAQNLKQKLHYIRGYAFYLAQREEEAIEDLKKAAFGNQKEVSLAQKAHLLLIASYFAKAKEEVDANVHYLVKLFLKKYPQSDYKPILLDWYTKTK